MNLKAILIPVMVATTLSGCATEQRRWLAGDHHIHSRYSVGWEESDPPRPIIGGDAIYPIPTNAEMAQKFGLDWMVATDHGGPNHAKINLEQAYPELVESREAVPGVLQFFGLELNSPGADHSSIIVPHTHDEAQQLHAYESRFDKRQPWPPEPARDSEDLMLEAIRYADNLPVKPLVIAHHPSRSSPALGEPGLTSPAELRAWNDAAPEVAVGMEGAPGHQAATISERNYNRGAYSRGYPTHGGFDQMTAVVGGFWDSMLGEGRRWWITANSDSHIHYTEGGVDFWPGEYSKTYVYARKTFEDILEAIRGGRIFVTLGDLVSELVVTAANGAMKAAIGEELLFQPGDEISVRIRIRDPDTLNAAGNNPAVKRVDLIIGDITGPVSDEHAHHHASTRVAARFSSQSWQQDGEYLVMEYNFKPTGPVYLRLRGTNTDQAEPLQDEAGEDPWLDLWFYSNPVFISLK